MTHGYIKLHRQIQDNDEWHREPFSRAQAWIDMLLNAAYKDTSVRIRGIKVPLSRGQLALSEVEYAKRWKWSRGKVRRFLAEIETKTVQQIVQQKTNVTSVVTILNYERYQGDGTADSTANGTADGTASSTADGHIQEGKEDKEGKEREEKRERVQTAKPVGTSKYPDGFIEAWDTYPYKRDKAGSARAFKSAIKAGITLETIMGCIVRYQSTVWKAYKRQNPDYNGKMMSAWLRTCPWDDEEDHKSEVKDHALDAYAIELRILKTGYDTEEDQRRFKAKVVDAVGFDAWKQVKEMA